MATKTAIVMSVYRPDDTYLHAQIRSLTAQSTPPIGISCVIADQVSGTLVEQLFAAAGLPYKIIVPEAPLDAVRAFALGLEQALGHWSDADSFAFCDQDDIWHPDRIRAGQDCLRGAAAALVHSDAEIVDQKGAPIHASLWQWEGRATSDTAADLLYRNTVTGMTALFRRDVAEAALPFPRQDGVHFYHDLWLALVANTMGGVARVPQPLVKYRQHANNAIGAARMRLHPNLRRFAGAYALSRYLAITLQERFGPQPGLGGYRSLRHLGLSFLMDSMRSLISLDPRQAAHALLYFAITWARLVVIIGQSLSVFSPKALRTRLAALDRRLYGLSPGQEPTLAVSPAPPPAQAAVPWWTYFDGRMAAKWRPIFSATQAGTTILLPTLNPKEAFAGIATAIDLGLEMADLGETVRFIATDLPIASLTATRAFLAQRALSNKTLSKVSIHCGVSQSELPVHKNDRVMATAWWTAHVAQKLKDQHAYGQDKFLYLIQDYEPLFYPWGTEHAAALASYDLPCTPIFNSTPLANYCSHLGHHFDAPFKMTFCPSIDINRYAGLKRCGSDKKRIVVYGRPEVPRNLFPLCIEGLGRFIEQSGLTSRDCEVVSVGLAHGPVLLPGAIEMSSLGKLPWDDYPTFLSQSDIGLSLMMSPHPSHPPIEMAAAGMRVVTNTFATKDLAPLAPHIFSADLTPQSIAEQLQKAWITPEPASAQRHFSLSSLGVPLSEVAAALCCQKPRLRAA